MLTERTENLGGFSLDSFGCSIEYGRIEITLQGNTVEHEKRKAREANSFKGYQKLKDIWGYDSDDKDKFL